VQPGRPAVACALGRLRRGQGPHVRAHRHRPQPLVRGRGRRQAERAAEPDRPPALARPVRADAGAGQREAAAPPASEVPPPAEGRRARGAGPLRGALTWRLPCGENRRRAREQPDPRSRRDLERVARRGAHRDGSAATLVVKLASDDPMSRATGVGMGAYHREIAFYRELAPRIGGPLAPCLLAEYDAADGWFTLVLGDIAGAVQGDQIAGCGLAQARIAMETLALVHAPVLGEVTVGTAEFLNQPNPLDQGLLTQLLPGFLERYGPQISDEHAELCRRFVASLDAWAADRRPPLGLVHGDYRLDNLLFAEERAVVVDWQTVSWGPALLDASYFIGGCLDAETRRAGERELLATYHEALTGLGVRGLSLEQCWEEYRRLCFHGLLMTIAASMVVVRTERGDEMFMSWFARNAQQAIDLEAVELLPEPRSGRLPALRPEQSDEGRHEPGPEALWNESWYFDAVSDDGTLGVYVRLGRLPNQGVALYTACVCGPGRPSVMLVDAAAPLPDAGDEEQTIETPGLRASQSCVEPLERFEVRARGTAQAHTDESAPLRGEAGEPIEVSLELSFQTDGIPYAWRQST